MDRAAFTERELDIRSVLWRTGSGTVSEVRESLDGAPGYTTVLKMLQILEEKGAVRHVEEGRAYRYLPVVQPDAAGGPALRRILDKFFHGSAETMLARLVSATDLSADDLARMRRLLDDAAARAESEEEGS
ncbi:MAG: BlaI/MecI/CopY family transcriptional regulator [Gemmatimonadetes bacterium]|nr:BlaI/MecI/CopY family transcriptional regulator [Gemmatimonadota bacterium]